MLYSDVDLSVNRKTLRVRWLIALAILIVPNLPAFALVFTARIKILSMLLSFIGVFGLIFYCGFFVAPVASYQCYLLEVTSGRRREFSGVLIRMEENAVRDHVPCRAMIFEENGQERLCYFDLYKYPEKDFEQGKVYRVAIHGQSILALEPENK